MKAIVNTVLSQEEAVGHVASAYIDDIYVNKDVVPTTCVREDLDAAITRSGIVCGSRCCRINVSQSLAGVR